MRNFRATKWQVAIGTVILVAVVIGVTNFKAVKNRADQVGFTVLPPEISSEGVITNQVIVFTNLTRRPLSISFTHQIYSNATWHPPKERLFIHPSHELGPGDNPGYMVPDPPIDLPWRFAVVVQKHYGDGTIGELREWLDEKFYPELNKNYGHQRPRDAFWLSAPMGNTNALPPEIPPTH